MKKWLKTPVSPNLPALHVSHDDALGWQAFWEKDGEPLRVKDLLLLFIAFLVVVLS